MSLQLEPPIPGRLVFGIKQSKKKKSLQRLHQDITSWKSKIHTPSENRTKVTSRSQIITARVSTIISAAVEVVSGSPTVGRCYVAVFLEDSDEVIKGLLCRGYIYDLNPVSGNGAMVAKEGDRLRIESRCSLADVTIRVRGTQLRNQVLPGGWTGTDKTSTEGPGHRKSVTGTDPAAGNDIVETVPDNARWRIISFDARFITDATSTNRNVRLIIDDGSGNNLVRSPIPDPIGATQDNTFNYFENAPITPAGAVAGIYNAPLPNDNVMFQGWRIVTSTANIQAGDNWGAPTLGVEEWLDPA